MRPRRLLARLASGHFQNVSFADARALVEAAGFAILRIEGSHHIFSHPAIPELVNLQNVGGEAKPYQLRQFLKLLERYDLRLGDGE